MKLVLELWGSGGRGRVGDCTINKAGFMVKRIESCFQENNFDHVIPMMG